MRRIIIYVSGNRIQYDKWWTSKDKTTNMSIHGNSQAYARCFEDFPLPADYIASENYIYGALKTMRWRAPRSPEVRCCLKHHKVRLEGEFD